MNKTAHYLKVLDLTRDRLEDIHQLLQKRMLASKLVGAPNPWGHRDFIAFKAGFNCIEGRNLISQVRNTTNNYQLSQRI